MPLGLMLLYGRLKRVARDQLQNLAEDAAYSFQGEASLVLLVFVLGGMNSHYQRLRPSTYPANLDTSEEEYVVQHIGHACYFVCLSGVCYGVTVGRSRIFWSLT